MKITKMILALSILVVFSNCKKDEVEPVFNNLITNPSFEIDGESSFEGWTGSSFSFVEDTPQDGGDWALQLEPEWLPGNGFAETSITGLSGTFGFNFTCDAKVISAGSWGQGHISFQLKTPEDSIMVLSNAAIANPEWEQKSFSVENIELQVEDELIVHFTAGGTEVANWQVLIDNVVLEIMD